MIGDWRIIKYLFRNVPMQPLTSNFHLKVYGYTFKKSIRKQLLSSESVPITLSKYFMVKLVFISLFFLMCICTKCQRFILAHNGNMACYESEVLAK